jgi:hypothetical protein
MARNGERFLERTREEFLEDLVNSFGERSDEFGGELKVLLFELWVRARSRPPFPVHRPEPTDDMKQEEFEARLATALAQVSSSSSTELQHEFVKSIQRSITVGQGITRNDQMTCLSLHLDPARPAAIDQRQFSELLDKSLRLEGDGLEKWLDPANNQLELGLKLKGASGAAGIPELDELAHPDGNDEDQRRLTRRLDKLGLVPPADWMPVFQHRDTGVRAGLDVGMGTRYFTKSVETYLVYDGLSWKFPTPKPLHTYDGNLHIRLWVDNVEQMNSACTWSDIYDHDLFKQVVEAVTIPAAMNTSQVRAVYTTITSEYLP